MVLALGLAACSGSGAREPVATPASSPPAIEEPAVPATAPVAPEDAAAAKAVALITDPAALAAIVEAGGAYDAMLDDADRAVIVKTTRADIAATGKGDKDAGVGIAGNTHRLFDGGWLT